MYLYRRATSYIEGLSDAGCLKFESQLGRVTGKTFPRLWGDECPAIKGLRLPERHAGHFLLVFVVLLKLLLLLVVVVIT